MALALLLLDSSSSHSFGSCEQLVCEKKKQYKVHSLKEIRQNKAAATCCFGSGSHYFGFICQVSSTLRLCVSHDVAIELIKA